MFGLGGLFDRDAQLAINNHPGPVINVAPVNNPADYGLLQGYAQAVQKEIGKPNIAPDAPFSLEDFDAATWFTTRSHLNPLGQSE